MKDTQTPKKQLERIEIVWRKLSEIQPNMDNPRVLTKEDFNCLKQSFIDNPNLINGKPLLLSDRTGSLIIIGGNSRYQVAKHLKYKELPTLLLKGLTEKQEREIIIRDNVNNGNWDMDMLANDWDMDLLSLWGLDVKAKEKSRETNKTLRLKFTNEEYELVKEQLDFLAVKFDCDSVEMALIKILNELCSTTQS